MEVLNLCSRIAPNSKLLIQRGSVLDPWTGIKMLGCLTFRKKYLGHAP